MAFDFPASPTVNQVFTGSNGAQYLWNGVTWNQVSGNPATLTAQARNRVVNGAMQISQENGATSVGSNAYPADQWMLTFVSSSVINTAQVKGAAGSDTPNYIAMNVSPPETSAAAGEFAFFQQIIEGVRVSDFRWGTAQAQATILAFHVNVPVAGTYWVAVMNMAGTHTFLGAYTISAGEVSTWVRKTVTIPAGAINAGTWPIGAVGSVILRFTFHCGSTLTGVTGFQAAAVVAGPGQALGLSTANQCWLTNVGLYLDDQNTGVPPPWVMPDEAEELRACRRYYIKTTGPGAANYVFGGYAGANSTWYMPLKYPERMRGLPAVALTNASTTGVASAVVNNIGVEGAAVTLSVNSGVAFWYLTDLLINARM